MFQKEDGDKQEQAEPGRGMGWQGIGRPGGTGRKEEQKRGRGGLDGGRGEKRRRGRRRGGWGKKGTKKERKEW